MRFADQSLIFSATDVSNFLACPHLSLLNRITALGGPKPPKFDDPGVDVLRERGLQHEQAYLAGLKGDAGSGDVIEIEGPDAVSATIGAMRAGASVIYQGALERNGWFGLPDFLKRVDRPSRLGNWSYEVIDAKLAREAKGGALLQLLVYADLLENVQGIPPEYVHLALGGPDARTASFRVANYGAYFRSIRGRFAEHIADAQDDPPYAPDPVIHCEICAWKIRCDRERRDVDHLSLVADIRKTQRRALEQIGISTVEELAVLDVERVPALDGTSRSSLERIREQARIQVEGRNEGRPKYELLQPVHQNEGLAALPPPSPGDVFFDLEGDPYALTDGIEYLFGYVDRDGGFTGRWALDRESEKRVFEEFIDFIMDRLAKHPDLHIYHYAPYETTAMKRLMGRYATREEEVDRLLRGKVFVDLYRVAKQGLRASVESYSIKRLEPLYGFERAVELRQASSALAHFEAWLELADDDDNQENELLEQIEGYNRDDCLSTLRLRDWLEGLRDELAVMIDAEVPRPEPGDQTPSSTVAEEDEVVARLGAALTEDVPADEAARSPEQQGRWILAQILGYHRREQKASWWEYFRCRDLSDDELIEDAATMGGLEYIGVVGQEKQSLLHGYRFPHQEHPLRQGDKPENAQTGSGAGEVWRIDDSTRTIVLKRGKANEAPHPRGLIKNEIYRDADHRLSIRRVAQSVIDSGVGEGAIFRAAADLLMRHAPRVGGPPGDGATGDGYTGDGEGYSGEGEGFTRGGEGYSGEGDGFTREGDGFTREGNGFTHEGDGLACEGEASLDAARRLIGKLDRSILPIQGPPGSGKTFTGARMILEALRAGKRVGITATSHKVISNLLDEVCKAATEQQFTVRGIQKADDSQRCGSTIITSTSDNAKVFEALTSGDAHLAAGTAWLWCREDMIGSVDLLFIDEAGQFSLADALAVAPAADSLVLLGDPMQLDRPQQGVHPPGSDASALGHVLDGAATMPPDRGLFLEHTWRLHPSICRFTSEIFYAGRLEPRDNLHLQRVNGVAPLDGSGLRFIPAEHDGNRNESPEEVEIVAALVSRLLDAPSRWIDRDGITHVLQLDDILIVAPYNAHVTALAENLPAGARIGTVDKFQGQEAPIVIYSVATSTAEEAPRGMSFLFSPNRLNVATSRARALAVVVANPALFQPECRTPEQMRLANAFCRFLEMATGETE